MKHTVGPQSVGHIQYNKWLLDNALLEARLATIYDLDTEFAVTQSDAEKMFSKFNAFWTIRGSMLGVLTLEFLDLFYFRIKADLKLFQMDPFSYEVLEPDYTSGNFDKIRQKRMRTCQGGYFNTMAFPLEIKVDLNVKRCETSLVDWVTNKSKYGKGFHVLCFYDPTNEVQVTEPYKYEGWTSKRPYFESCFRTKVVEDTAETIIIPDRPIGIIFPDKPDS